jgi:hypothetical protein
MTHVYGIIIIINSRKPVLIENNLIIKMKIAATQNLNLSHSVKYRVDK